jgi:hypothetical protein
MALPIHPSLILTSLRIDVRHRFASEPGTGRSGVEEAALWAVLGVTAFVGVLIGGTYVHEWLHYRRAAALGRRKKQRLQL